MSIKSKIENLRNNEETSNIGIKWSVEEDNKLLEELNINKTYNEIALEHKRTIGGIKSRIISHIIYPKYKNDDIDFDKISIEYKIEKDIIIKYINELKLKSSKLDLKDDNKILELNNKLNEIDNKLNTIYYLVYIVYFLIVINL